MRNLVSELADKTTHHETAAMLDALAFVPPHELRSLAAVMPSWSELAEVYELGDALPDLDACEELGALVGFAIAG